MRTQRRAMAKLEGAFLLLMVVGGTSAGIFGLVLAEGYRPIPLSLHLPAITTTLDVKVYNGTSLVGHSIKEDDLTLDNFNLFLQSFLFGTIGGVGGQSVTLTTIAGASATFNVWVSGSGNGITFIQASCEPNCGGQIELGTSNVAAARSDHAIGVAYLSFFNTVSTSCNTGATDSVIVSGSETATSGATIQESVLGIQQGSSREIFFHDTFAGITVAAGNTIVVQYTLNLPATYSQNLCNYLAEFFNNGFGTSSHQNAFTMVASDGTTPQFCIWTVSSGASALLNGACSGFSLPANPDNIAMGTGTTSFTPTSYALTSQQVTAAVSSNNYQSTLGIVSGTAQETFTGAITVSEVGVYILANSKNWFMVYMTFPGQSVSANAILGCTVQVTD